MIVNVNDLITTFLGLKLLHQNGKIRSGVHEGMGNVVPNIAMS